MDTRSMKRLIARPEPPSADAGEGAAVPAAVAAASAAAAAEAPAAQLEVSDLWPLSPRFPGPALQLVRSKLPTVTLSAVRLVNRAARADLVDGRATRVWRCPGLGAQVNALGSAAPRLRSLVSLKMRSSLCADECVILGGVLERLPGGGAAALRELDLGRIEHDARWAPYPPISPSGSPSTCLERFAAAVSRLSGLASFKAAIHGCWSDGAAALVGAAGRLPALARLSLHLRCHFEAGQSLQMPPLATLRRLQALDLSGGAAALWLPSLFEPATAAALTRLRDLSVEHYSSNRRLPAAPWRAPRMAQLTRLALEGDRDQMRLVSRELTPGALSALRTLEISTHDCYLGTRKLRRIIAACGAARGEAALQMLALDGVAGAAVRDVAASLPALRALELFNADFTYGGLTDSEDDDDGGGAIVSDEWRDPNDVAFCAFMAAPLAPLTRLELHLGSSVAARLPAMFAAGWATALREVALRAIGDFGGCGPPDTLTPRALRGLSALTALTRLALVDLDLGDGGDLEAAAAEGANVWAPRLVELELETCNPLTDGIIATLLALPLSRLERLGVRSPYTARATLSAACAARLPRLTALEFSA